MFVESILTTAVFLNEMSRVYFLGDTAVYDRMHQRRKTQEQARQRAVKKFREGGVMVIRNSTKQEYRFILGDHQICDKYTDVTPRGKYVSGVCLGVTLKPTKSSDTYLKKPDSGERRLGLAYWATGDQFDGVKTMSVKGVPLTDFYMKCNLYDTGFVCNEPRKVITADLLKPIAPLFRYKCKSVNDCEDKTFLEWRIYNDK